MTRKRLAYYSVSLSSADPRPDILWQLETSVRSLRAHNSTIPVYVFVYGDPPETLRARLEGYGITVRYQGRYEDRLRRFAPRVWPVLAHYPILHKFLNFPEIAARAPAQVLLLDCDTVFFRDVESLFDGYSEPDCCARADIGARRGPFEYDPAYLSEETLAAIGEREGVRPTPAFSCGVILFNNRLWRRFRHLETTLLAYAWRLLLWMALHPVRAGERFVEGRGVGYLRRHFHQFAPGSPPALPYPSSNRWLLEQVALWLALGHVEGLTYRDIRPRHMMYFSEFQRLGTIPRDLVICHYGSRNTLAMRHRLERDPAGNVGRRHRTTLPNVPPARVPSDGQSAASGPAPTVDAVPGLGRSWPLSPSVCPCDLHFVEYLRANRVGGKTIFHFGTGEHHVVGRAVGAAGTNDVLAITASRQEHQAYVDLIAESPRIGLHYKVLLADIYTMTANLLPRFDVVTLFHLHEFWRDDRRPVVAHDDDGVLRMFLQKLLPGGQLLFYSGSTGFPATREALERLVARRVIRQTAEFHSILVYQRRPRCPAARPARRQPQ
jgi:hypothetical protein